MKGCAHELLERIKALFSRKSSIQTAISHDLHGVTSILHKVSTTMSNDSNVGQNEVTFVEECWNPDFKTSGNFNLDNAINISGRTSYNTVVSFNKHSDDIDVAAASASVVRKRTHKLDNCDRLVRRTSSTIPPPRKPDGAHRPRDRKNKIPSCLSRYKVPQFD